MRRNRSDNAHRGSAAAAAPFDVLAAIFLDLDLADLYKCQLVCKAWRHAARDDLVLRALCWRKGYAPGKRRLSDLRKPCRSTLADDNSHSDGHAYPLYRMQGRDDAASWEEVLKRDRLLRRIKFPPSLEETDSTLCEVDLDGVVKCYSNHERELRSDIWQVRVDPIDSVLITTGSRGGLKVLDLESSQELWRDAGVVSFARLEHSEGWVVHDQDVGNGQGPHLEIRKFERLVDGLDRPRRGHLASVGTISFSTYPRTWCLTWPYLAAVTDWHVAVYDIRDLHIVKHFRLSDYHIQPARFISMDDDFIFVLSGYRTHSHSRSEHEHHDVGGLLVYERKKGGRLIFDGWKANFTSASSWNIEAHGLDRLHFKDQPLEGCPSLGIATRLSPRSQSNEEWRAGTWWCQAVLPDRRTGSLVLSGRGHLLVIPNYKQAFEGTQSSIYAISIGGGNLCSRQCTSGLGVADGTAAFVAAVHNLPIWVDLDSLIRASSGSRLVSPRASTLCLGQTILYDSTALNFQKSSCIFLDSARIVVVADILQEDASRRPIAIKTYSLAVAMDFGAVLSAKLDFPALPLDQQPTWISVMTPRRSSADEEERASWRKKRDECAAARVMLPSGEARWWDRWAPHLLSEQPTRKRWKASRSSHESAVRRWEPPPRSIAWRGRVAWGADPDGTHFWDRDFTEEAMANFFGSLPGAGRGVDPEDRDGSDDGEVEVVEDFHDVDEDEEDGNDGGIGLREDDEVSKDDDGQEADDEEEDEGEGYDHADENESNEDEIGDPHDARETHWTDEEEEDHAYERYCSQSRQGARDDGHTGAAPWHEYACHAKKNSERRQRLFDYGEDVGYDYRQLSKEDMHHSGEPDQDSEIEADGYGDIVNFALEAAVNQDTTGGASYVPRASRAGTFLFGDALTHMIPSLKPKLPIDS